MIIETKWIEERIKELEKELQYLRNSETSSCVRIEIICLDNHITDLKKVIGQKKEN